MLIGITGLIGSGKSTIAKRIAYEQNIEYYALDDFIKKAYISNDWTKILPKNLKWLLHDNSMYDVWVDKNKVIELFKPDHKIEYNEFMQIIFKMCYEFIRSLDNPDRIILVEFASIKGCEKLYPLFDEIIFVYCKEKERYLRLINGPRNMSSEQISTIERFQTDGLIELSKNCKEKRVHIIDNTSEDLIKIPIFMNKEKLIKELKSSVSKINKIMNTLNTTENYTIFFDAGGSVILEENLEEGIEETELGSIRHLDCGDK